MSTLMLAGVRDFVIVAAPDELLTFQRLFQNAPEELGVNVTILPQPRPLGIADAFRIVHKVFGKKIFSYDTHALILGDNIFYGSGLSGLLQNIDPLKANVFLYPVQNPQDFGVAQVEGDVVVSIEEKPKKPKSNLAVTGLYFYPPSAYLYADILKPSDRGELEITDLNKCYLKMADLRAINLLRGMVWFDTGTPDAMLEASNFVQNIQKHQNYLVGSPHEIAINQGWVTKESITPFIERCAKTQYGKYLQTILDKGAP